MDERIPSPDDLRAIAECVQFLVGMSGPLAPPGYERAEAADDAWPALLDVELMNALRDAVDIFASMPRCSEEGFGLVVEGWPLEVEFALYQARSAVRELAERWGAAAGENDDEDDETPMPRLVVDEGLHDELRWSHNLLALVLKDEGQDESNEDLDEDLIIASQAMLAAARGLSPRRGLLRKWLTDGTLVVLKRSGGKWAVRFRDPAEHARVKTEVDRQRNKLIQLRLRGRGRGPADVN
jgi:hypothetical protein